MAKLHHIFVHVAYDHGWILLWWDCDILCTVLQITSLCLQCFDAVACSRKGIRPVELSGMMLAWLSVWAKEQICIWPSWSPFLFYSFNTCKNSSTCCVICWCDIKPYYSISLPLIISCFNKSWLVLPFWYWLTCLIPDTVHRAVKWL